MKRRIVQILLLLLPTLLPAQNFYMIGYTGETGNKHHAMVVYRNEKSIIVRHYHESSGDLYVDSYSSNEMDDASGKSANLVAAEKAAVEASAVEVDLTVWATKDEKAPVYIWYWRPDLSEEEQFLPYVAFSLDDVTALRLDKWVRADYFMSLQLADMTDEMLNYFFRGNNEKDLTYYNKIRAARDQAQRNVLQEMGEAQNTNPDACTLHLIELTNTTIGDIGAHCLLDNKAMKNEMSGITRLLGMNLKVYDVSGLSFGFSGLQNILDSVKVKSNDVILFHYSGHGFRFDDQEDPFPQMLLCSNEYMNVLDHNYASLSEVYSILDGKGARLCLVLADCCNSMIGVPVPVASNSLQKRDRTNYDRSRIEDLFLRASGSLISSAASPGEVSWCDMQGGMFTNAFLQSLRNEIGLLNQEKASWESVIDNTIVQAQSRSSQLAKAQNGIKKSKGKLK